MASLSGDDAPPAVQFEGANAAPTEQASTVAVPGVPSPVRAQPQIGGAASSAAALRAFLARRYIYASWYTRVREVTVRNRVATVSSWHLGEENPGSTAREICAALLGSHRVAEARVRYEPGNEVACS